MDDNKSLIPVNPQKALQRINKQIEVADDILQRIRKKSEIKEKNIVCPRCLGKRYVDWADIKRLNNIGYWGQGNCAYCGATGFVPESRLKKIDPAERTLVWHNRIK